MTSPALNHTQSELRTCASCSVQVPKADVHKNRYAQYICRNCRSSGVKVVGRKSLRRSLSRMPAALALVLLGVVPVLLLLVIVIVASSVHSYSNGGMVDDLKSVVRSLNQMAH